MIATGVMFALVASLALTGLARAYALRRELMDVPNSRSSHSRPTPRGGGIAIVLTFVVGLLLVRTIGLISPHDLVALLGAGVGVAAIGFVDDHRHVPAKVRLVVHCAAAVWVVYWMGVRPEDAVGAASWPAWFGGLLAAVFVVWLLNLYNFMDGIDGLAAVEAVTACLGAAWLAFRVVPSEGAWVVALLLAAAAAGFMAWNLPPARIFMGDVGSGFLGVCLAALALQSLGYEPALFWCWTILLGVFIVDATLTLVRRVARGDAFYQAHRTHAYQHAAHRFGHRTVTLAVGVLNMGWLLPIAWLVAFDHVTVPIGLAVAYAPLIGIALYFRAGAAE